MLLPHEPNRLAKFFPAVDPPDPPLADRVLDGCHGLKIEVFRCTDDDDSAELMISYELHGSLPEEESDLLAALLSRLSRKGGAA